MKMNHKMISSFFLIAALLLASCASARQAQVNPVPNTGSSRPSEAPPAARSSRSAVGTAGQKTVAGPAGAAPAETGTLAAVPSPAVPDSPALAAAGSSGSAAAATGTPGAAAADSGSSVSTSVIEAPAESNAVGSPTQSATAAPTQSPAAPFAVTDVEESVNLNSVSMASYNGICQASLAFSANISTNSAGTVTYHWLRSNGSSSPEASVTFTEIGVQTVTDTWTLASPGGAVTAWDRLYIDQPAPQSYTTTGFSLICNPALPKPKPSSGKPVHHP